MDGSSRYLGAGEKLHHYSVVASHAQHERDLGCLGQRTEHLAVQFAASSAARLSRDHGTQHSEQPIAIARPYEPQSTGTAKRSRKSSSPNSCSKACKRSAAARDLPG